jgi:ABC-2 type transport system ATP-binding protein
VLAIDAKQVRQTYRNGVEALKGIDLEVRQGEIFCLVGPNGAGKTTLVRILGTQLVPTSGTVEILGLDLARQVRQIRRRIAAVPQGAYPDPYLKVWEHIYYYLLARGSSRSRARQAMESIVQRLGLAAKIDAQISILSGGMRRRVLLAMALASEADFLLLDEPTTGLDLLIRRETWNVLSGLREEGRALLLTTHSMEEAEFLADRVGIVNEGRLVAVGTPAELRRLAPGRQKVVFNESSLPRPELEAFGRIEEFAGKWAIFVQQDEELRRLLDFAVERRVEAAVFNSTLEDVFVHMVTDGHRLRMGELK